MADLMFLNLAIGVGLLRQAARRRVMFGAAGVFLVLAALSSGEFSSALGLVVAAVTIVVVARDYRLLAWFPVLGALGALAVWPVIEKRLSEFQTLEGLPPSWLGRLYNLQNYFWPQLLDDHSYLLGVRSSARIALPHKANGFIWIESGYTWLLWSGGITMLVAYVAFSWSAGSRGLRVARGPADAIAVAGTALVTMVCAIAVLMMFDPHVTYRGTADALFALVALTAVRRPRPSVATPSRWEAAGLRRSSGTAPDRSNGSPGAGTSAARGGQERAPGAHRAPPRVRPRSTPPRPRRRPSGA
jgi:hypothetical protein